MERQRWIIIIAVCLLLIHETHGRPAKNFGRTNSNKKHSPVISGEDGYPDNVSYENRGRSDAMEKTTNKQSNFDKEELEVDLGEDWPITPNYEIESNVGKEIDDLSEIPKPLEPILSTLEMSPTSGVVPTGIDEELEEDLEVFTQGSVRDESMKSNGSAPAELRKLPIPIDIDSQTPDAEHKASNAGIGTVFSLNEDFTDAEFAIAEAPETSANKTFEEVPAILETETVSLNEFVNTSMFAVRVKPKFTSKDEIKVESTVTAITKRPHKMSSSQNVLKATTELYPITTFSSHFSVNETVLEEDETAVVLQTVKTLNVKVTEPTKDNNILVSTITTLPTTTSTTPKPFTRRYPTSHPNVSLRPTIRRRITVPTTTQLAFLITTTTKKPIITAASSTTAKPATKDPKLQSKPLNKINDTQVFIPKTTTATTTTTAPTTPIKATTTKKQFMVTVPPLEDEFTEPSNTLEVQQQDSDINLVPEINETLSSTTSLNFNGLWNLFSVEASNAIVISVIIGGCAIIFFSILMVFCMWRQHVSRRPNYPPTESSNCSSNNSASSFIASKSG